MIQMYFEIHFKCNILRQYENVLSYYTFYPKFIFYQTDFIFNQIMNWKFWLKFLILWQSRLNFKTVPARGEKEKVFANAIVAMLSLEGEIVHDLLFCADLLSLTK